MSRIDRRVHKEFFKSVLIGLKWVLIYVILGIALIFLSLA
jgi:hypothetical protein